MNKEEEKNVLPADAEEAIKWLSEKDAARYRKDFERLNKEELHKQAKQRAKK